MAADRLQVLAGIIDQAIIPVFFDADPEVCVGVISACARAGARHIEFTNRGRFAPQIFLELSREFARTDPGLSLGVGSIVDAPTAALYLAAGASFVVGPVLNPEVAQFCNRRMVPYSPGCGSASEIGQAHEFGCEIVKVFPGASAGGPDFVKSVLGPMPWTKMMPTGGVEPTEASLRAWFSAGVVACGIGSNLLTRDLIEARDWTALESRVREALELANQVRGSRS